MFGWIQTGHQLGAAVAAFGAGVVRQHVGSYLPSFIAAGVMGLLASAVLVISLKASQVSRTH